jgi:hypothetical protein
MRGLTTTILLVVVLAGLGGYIYYLERNPPAAEADAREDLFDVEGEQIQELRIAVADGDTTVARRTGNGWQLVEPVEAEADTSELNNIATSLASLDIQRVVAENATDLAEFGLAEPKIEITFRTGQDQPQRLQVGDRTPTGGDVYARKPDENRVVLVPAIVEDTFRRTAFDLRNKMVLAFDRDKVDGLEIARGGETLQFARKGADWTIVRPAAMRADYAAIEGLVTSLQATQATKFVTQEPTAQELREYGLTQPRTSASILMGSDRVTLQLGATDNAETYARNAAREGVVMVAPTIVSDLAKPLEDFRRRDLFDLRSFSTKRVQITRGSESFTFEKVTGDDGAESWKNASGATVDSMTVEDVLTKLSNLRIGSFQPRQDQALQSPALVVAATFGQNKDENRMETVTLARAGDAVVASRPDEPGTLTVEGTSGLEEIFKALDGMK